MFNFSGSEIVFLLLIALVVLGPEKLPEAIRRFGKTYAEFKKMSTGFQTELKSALDEPMREMRETADAFKKAATIEFDAGSAEASTTSHQPAPDAAVANGSAPPLASGSATTPEPEPEPDPAVIVDAPPEPVARGIDSIVVRDAPVAKPPAAEPPVSEPPVVESPAEGEQGAAPA
ncbi:MAG: twin-arginine translocase TatA/TatE family subunit [Ilumatobacteraceae bacterium]